MQNLPAFDWSLYSKSPSAKYRWYFSAHLRLVTCRGTGYWFWFWVWNLPKCRFLSHSIINAPLHLRIGVAHFSLFSMHPQVYVLEDWNNRNFCVFFPGYLVYVGESDLKTNIFSHSSVASGLCIAANGKPGNYTKLLRAWGEKHSHSMIYFLCEAFFEGFHCSAICSA